VGWSGPIWEGSVAAGAIEWRVWAPWGER
jgi:hypothetical protein